MKNVFFSLFMFIGVAGFSQETYCSNPSPNNTNTAAALNFTATSSPTTGWKYWTTNTIITSGNINLTNNKLFSQTSVKLQSGFKATSTGNKIVVGVGSCSTPSGRVSEDVVLNEKEKSENKLSETNATILIYPNPNNGNFTVDVGDFKSGVIYVEDITGKLISKQVINEESTYQFQLNDATGMYLVKICSDDQMVIKKIVVD